MFDINIYQLGSLCKNGHEWKETGKSLRYIKGCTCVECNKNNQKIYHEKHREDIRNYYIKKVME